MWSARILAALVATGQDVEAERTLDRSAAAAASVVRDHLPARRARIDKLAVCVASISPIGFGCADGAIQKLSRQRARAIRVKLTIRYAFAADRPMTGGVGASRPHFQRHRHPLALEAGRASCRAPEHIPA